MRRRDILMIYLLGVSLGLSLGAFSIFVGNSLWLAIITAIGTLGFLAFGVKGITNLTKSS